MMRVFSILAACLVVAVACVNTSDASLLIRLDDTAGNVVVIADNGAGDTNSTLGVVSYSGGLGTSAWAVNVTTGLGAPLLGTPNLPNIDLNSVNVTATGAGTLNVAVTQTNNNQVASPIAFSFAGGGVTGGSWQGSAFANADNLPFSLAGAVQLGGVLGPFSSGGSPAPFAASTTGSALGVTTGGGNYSLTVQAQIVHSGPGKTTSFDAELQAIPEPASIAAWGLLGMMGLGLVWFKRRK